MSYLSVRYPDDPDMWTPTRHPLDLPEDVKAELRAQAAEERRDEDQADADDERWAAERDAGWMPSDG